MGRFPRSIILAAMVVSSCCVPMLALAEMSAEQALNTMYEKYDQKHSCWITVAGENNQRYCMKVDSTKKISAASRQRLYVLVVGNAIDNKGEPNGAHVTEGLVGAFVLEERNGDPEIIAANPKIMIGASGEAPTGWKLSKLGPANYWGWQNTSGDCHQGYCGSRYAILAPSGKGIRDLAGFIASYDDSGVGNDNSTTIDSKLEMDTTQTNSTVFPLLVTITGTDQGKALVARTWTLPFDPKGGAYIVPKDWPLNGRDF